MAIQTPSQTVGPFFTIGCAWLDTDCIGDPKAAGRITIRGRLLDGDGAGISDGLLEVWQADAQGRLDNPAFRGFGRIRTGDDGRFAFTTVRPGRLPGANGAPQAAHLLVGVFARGMLKRAATRMYFPGDPDHASDTVLGLVEGARRATLIARQDGPGTYEWNVVLQGADETVFFDL
jgi:protocatechuate 3,4-dioxygenase, alpha subunit